MKIPFWLKIGLWALEMLPGFPLWLKAIIPSLINLIQSLPLASQAAAQATLPLAVKDAQAQNSHAPIKAWIDAHCSEVPK